MSQRKRMPSYRPWGSTDDGNIEFESLTEETLEGALTVIREAFFTDENVSIGVDLMSEPGASEELERLCFDAVNDGVSVVAIDVTTGEVVGAALNKIQVSINFTDVDKLMEFNHLDEYKRCIPGCYLCASGHFGSGESMQCCPK